MRPDRRRAKLLADLEHLVHCAERVCALHGMHDPERGVPSDWTEWVDLRQALVAARHDLAAEGLAVPVLYETHHKKRLLT